MRLLEREAHLASLTEYADEAGRGQGRLILVSGEAGVGKSTLVDHLESKLPGVAWFWGACDGLFTPRPLAPVLDIGRQVGGHFGALCANDAPREQLFDAVLAELNTPELTVMVIEDIHWADEATLDLLRFLGRRIRHSAALILVSYRDDGLAIGDPLRVAVGELSTQRSTRRLGLPPLSPLGVAALAEGSGMDPVRLHDLTGGNPFYVSEVLQTSSEALPSSVRDAVLARLAGVSDESEQVLEIAALFGARVRPDVLQAICGASPEALDELVATGVLVGDGDQLRFRHEIARVAVQHTIAPHRAVRAHRAIVDYLLTTGCDDDARLAYHAEAAGDDLLVLTHAPAAGRRASRLASHREAVVQFERALRATSEAEDRTVAGLYDALASELALVDRWRESAEARESALSRWRQLGDPLREGDSLRLLSRTMWRLCRGAEADGAAVESLTKLDPLGPTTELAWARANLANHRLNRGEHDEAIVRAREARQIGEALGLIEVVTDSLNTEACAAAGLGTVWSPMLHQALDLAKAEGLDEQVGRAYANLYSMYSRSMRIPEGEGLLVEGIAYCDERDISTFGNCLRGERAIVLEKLGRYDEAERLAQELLDRTGPSPVNRLNPLVSLGRVRARRGDTGTWDCLDEARDLAIGLNEQEWTVLVRTARAEACWLDGRADDALGELAAADFAAPTNGGVERAALAVWQQRISGQPWSHTIRDFPDPFASELCGNHRLAADSWQHLGLRYDAALALLGSDDETDLRNALAALDDLGAVATASIARQRLRQRGVRSISSGVRASTREHPAGLTRREHEVLELLNEGLSNDEIAARLFVSAKTVEHHVSAILAKLDVNSRKAATQEANRRGLLGAPT